MKNESASKWLEKAHNDASKGGIIGTSGVGTSISGTTLGYTSLIQAQKDVADASAVLDPNSLGYATTPAVAQLLKAVNDSRPPIRQSGAGRFIREKLKALWRSARSKFPRPH